MRITCIIHSLRGGGAERLMAGLASRLADRGHAVTLVTLDHADGDRYSVAPAVRRVGLGKMGDSPHWLAGLWNNFGRLRAVRDAVRASDPQVVLSFCDTTNVLTLAAARHLRSNAGSVPIVVSEHTDPRHQPLSPPWASLRRRLYPRAAGAIALTESTARVIAEWTRRSVEVIPPAIDLPDPAPVIQPTAVPGSVLGAADKGGADTGGSMAATEAHRPAPWLCLGRLASEKAFERAIQSLAKLAPSYPGLRLVIAGEGDQRQALQREAERLEVADRIEFPGWVDDLEPLFARCQGFLLTSRYEGFPLGLLEAMAHGLACVAMDCQSGPAEILRDGENGRLVPAGDVDAMAAAMSQLMETPETTQAIRQVAAVDARRFSWDPFVEAHLQLLHRIVDSAG